MKFLTCLALTFILSINLMANESTTHILPALSHKNSSIEKVLIIIPGGLVPNHHYLQIAKSIQDHVQYKLWIGIVSCRWTGNLCNPLDQGPLGSNQLINKIFKEIKNQANNNFSYSDLYLAGHSLGGQSTFVFANKHPEIGGIIEWASYVNKHISMLEYPILTLGAELNGGSAKISKMAEFFLEYQDIVNSNGKNYAIKNKPVIIMPKVNHSDFCPGFFVKGDIKSDLSQEESTEIISKITADFLTVQISSNSFWGHKSFERLEKYINVTNDLTKGYLKAKDLEQSGKWCRLAQNKILESKWINKNNINITIQKKESSLDFMRSHTSVKAENPNSIELSISSFAIMPSTIMNNNPHYSADQIACKMASQEKMLDVLNINKEDNITSCREINELAYNFALNNITSEAKKRYLAKGKKIHFHDDFSAKIGPQFVFLSNLKYVISKNGLNITSPMLYSEMENNNYPGNHYCKLLSPARAMEWILIESLK